MVTINEYPVTTVSKKELEIAGFDVSNVTDLQMEKIGELMQESYLAQHFYRDLRRAAIKLGIPKIKRK